MADSRYRERSPARGAPRNPRDDSMEYRSSYDRYSRSSRSPDRDRGPRSQYYSDRQNRIPGENNYRPRYYSPPPPLRRDSAQKPKGIPPPTSTTDKIHPDRINLMVTEGDPLKCAEAGDLLVQEDNEMAPASVEVAEGMATAMQLLLAALAEFTALEMRRSMAQADFDRRQAEFNSSVAMHEKYPAVAEAQARSKIKAEEEVKAVVEESRTKKSSLDALAAKIVVSHVAPHMLKVVGSLQQQDFTSRFEQLEKRFDAMERQLEEKTRLLEASEVRSEDQKKVIESLLKYQEDQSKSLEAFRERSEAQQLSIESQLEAQQLEHKSLQAAQRRLSAEHADMKTLVNELCEIKLPSLDAIVSHLSESHDATKEATARLQEQVPQDLRARFEQLTHLPTVVASTRVAVEKIKQESNTSSDVAKKVWNIEQQLNDQRGIIHGLSGVVNGTSTPYSPGIAASVTELLKKNAGGSIGSIGSEELQQGMISISELEEDVAKLNSRLRTMEAQHLPTPSTPSHDPTDQAKFEYAEIQKKVLILDKKVASLASQVTATDKETLSMPQSFLEPLKREVFQSLKTDVLEVVEEKQSASDDFVEGLINGLKEQVASDRDRLCAVEAHNSSMDKAIPKQFERAETIFDQKVKQQLNEVNKNLSESLTTAVKKEAAEAVDRAAELFNSRIDAIYDGLVVLESRWNNITTKDMALFMINQLETAYPDVRNVQEALSNSKVQLGNFQSELNRITRTVDSISQTQASQSSFSEKFFQTLRSEVDVLTLETGGIKSALNDARKQRDADEVKMEEMRMHMAKEVSRFSLDIEAMRSA